MTAAYHGHSEVVALLAERGADIQAQNNVRENAIHFIILIMFIYNESMYVFIYMYVCDICDVLVFHESILRVVLSFSVCLIAWRDCPPLGC